MKIMPVIPIIKANLSTDELEKYNQIGKEVIQKGQVAVCTMAGGQGSRLGFDGPKGCFMLNFTKTNPKSIFEVQAGKLLKCKEDFDTDIKWYIMTSNENDADTKEFFQSNDYFGINKDYVVFFKQGEFPLVHEDGSDVLDENGQKVMAANGNGGIFKALEDEGIIDDMDINGIEYLVTCNVDNILVNPLDVTALGILKSNDTELGIKSIARTDPKEKVGSIVYKDGKPSVIEYIDMPEELLNSYNEDGSLMYSESHFGCNYLKIELLKRISNEKLPLHEAHKNSEKYGNYIKREMFIFDGFEKANSCEVIRAIREEEFSPIKNKEGVDSPETAIKMYEEYIKKGE